MTTVFVGKIPPCLDDDLLERLFKTCGCIKSWKPVKDPNTKGSVGFGFLEFEKPESVDRALHILSKIQIDGSQLLIKVNDTSVKNLSYCTNIEEISNTTDACVNHSVDNIKSVVGECQKQKLRAFDHGIEDVYDVQAEIINILTEQLVYSDPHSKKLTINDSVKTDISKTAINLMFSSRPISMPKQNSNSHEKINLPIDNFNIEKNRNTLKKSKSTDNLYNSEREREYITKLREWELYEDERQIWWQKFENRRKNQEKIREQSLMEDNTEFDSDDEKEHWRRKMLRSRRSDTTFRVKIREAHEDHLDRLNELKEMNLKMNHVSQTKIIAPLCRFSALADSTENSKPLSKSVPVAFQIVDESKLKKRVSIIDLKHDVSQRSQDLTNTQNSCGNSAIFTEGSSKTDVNSMITNWDDLCNYSIDWSAFDRVQNEGIGTLLPWIRKRVNNLAGETEESMIQFIFTKVCDHTSPKSLYGYLHQVLEDETQPFLLELYRFLVQETEKKLKLL